MDNYIEYLIKRKTPMKENLIKVMLVFVTVLLFVYGVMNFTFFIVAILMIGVDFLVFRNTNIEYEYLYINGQFDVDKIIAKSRRKDLFDTNVTELEIMAPEGSPELRQYQGLRKVDYTSGKANRKKYEMIVLKNGEKKRVLIEPTDAMVEAIWMRAPRKVMK